jgi:hypothetical protein
MDYIRYATDKICDAVAPVISDYIFKVYNNPMDYIDADKPGTIPTPSLINFQHALKKVPNLTGAQIKNFVSDIEKNCTWFGHLKDSVFVAYVKMVSSAIKMKASESRKLNIKPPTTDVFVHECLTLCAHNFYENPHVMKEHNEQKRDKEVDERIRYCISKAITNSIPMNEILRDYMSDIDQTDETSLEGLVNPEEPPPAETTAEDLPGPVSPTTESPFPETETKEVPGVPSQEAPKESEDAELFPDAPMKHPVEKKTN